MEELVMTCPICGQVAENVVAYEVHKRLGHESWYVQYAAILLGTIVLTVVLSAAVATAPRLVAKFA
ncbi:MAG: hypothetical protein ACP5PW_04845 [Candidatus Dormibacteria bacterium]